MANKNITQTPADVQDGFGTSWFDAVYTLHSALARKLGSREKTNPLGITDDSTSSDKGNQKNYDSDVRDEDSSLDPAAMVKQEMDVGPTVLQPPNVKMLPCKPHPENDLQIRTRHLWQDKTNKTVTKNNSLKSETSDDKTMHHICDVCNKSFLRKYDLQRHMLSLNTHTGHNKLPNTGERKNPCEVCNKTFTYKSRLRTHMLIHTGKREYECEICNKTFTHKSHLRTHLLIHTGKRDNLCDICKKTFTQKTHLKTHMLIHTGERQNQCNVCDKTFKQKAHLKRHMLIHTVAGREFRCNLCPKAFYTQVVLNSHRLSHSEHRPFKCDTCKKAFKLKAALARHCLVHSGEKPYPCGVCGQSFATRHCVQQHVRKVHNNEHIPHKPRVKKRKGRAT